MTWAMEQTKVGKLERFYFDAQNSSCDLFLYSGEGGNQNNFLTEIDCLNNCYIGKIIILF
uniref:BPTI/Kunitz inhibitor domain-containing protein n=1 Tax=Meloidogyne incognita TaxID=6306 RepID=A0A914P3V5_MELIC